MPETNPQKLAAAHDADTKANAHDNAQQKANKAQSLAIVVGIVVVAAVSVLMEFLLPPDLKLSDLNANMPHPNARQEPVRRDFLRKNGGDFPLSGQKSPVNN